MEQLIHIVDTEARQYSKTSRMITRPEFGGLFPEKMHVRELNFQFRFRVPMEISKKEADFLVKKFEAIKYSMPDGTIVSRKKALEKPKRMIDDLDEMDYFSLQRLARRFAILRDDYQVKKDKLILMLRKARAQGEPMSEENYAEHKKGVLAGNEAI